MISTKHSRLRRHLGRRSGRGGAGHHRRHGAARPGRGGRTPDDLAAAAFSMAGADWPEDIAFLHRAVGAPRLRARRDGRQRRHRGAVRRLARRDRRGRGLRDRHGDRGARPRTAACGTPATGKSRRARADLGRRRCGPSTAPRWVSTLPLADGARPRRLRLRASRRCCMYDRGLTDADGPAACARAARRGGGRRRHRAPLAAHGAALGDYALAAAGGRHRGPPLHLS